ncbi:MAG: tRNA (adenosine(37)-N6)-dimethylallyltransferase MiaA [Clostridia bacterium]|nr:tRNA (adenosine(37)-N6)-dimethylallyltransferase MiaA [Clostridia bacterium]
MASENNSHKKAVAAIIGPTATGKSEIALAVAAALKGEIISVDSVQVYRGMDIGTAKLLPQERVGPDGKPIRHHMLDIVDPDQPFSVADYQRMARDIIDTIHRRGNLPLLVGGTGLYYQAVVDPYFFTAMPANSETRQQLVALARKYGNNYLHERLQTVDPEAARRIHPNDRRRLVRALETYILTGRPISTALLLRRQQEPPYRLAAIGLTMPRQELYQRIEERVDKMIAQGLVAEVRQLLKQYDYYLPALQALGYREIGAYLRGETSFEEAVVLLKRNTRRLAKRQLTWFRRDQRIFWLELEGKKKGEITTFIIDYFREQLLLGQNKVILKTKNASLEGKKNE